MKLGDIGDFEEIFSKDLVGGIDLKTLPDRQLGLFFNCFGGPSQVKEVD